MRFNFTVLGAPIPCERARVYARGGRQTASLPARSREYQEEVRRTMLEARPFGWPLDREYRVRIFIYRARRAGDLDNFDKSICDACQCSKVKGTRVRLNDGVYLNDGQIADKHVRRWDGDPEPRVFVEFEVIDPLDLAPKV